MSSGPDTWHVAITENGREGRIVYREGRRALSFHWEFGGGEVVATVTVGDAAEWRARHGWAAGRRDEILARVIAETIRQKAPACRAALDAGGRFVNILSAAGGAAAAGRGAAHPRDARPAPATPARKRAEAAAMVHRLRDLRMRAGLAVLVLALAAAGTLLAGRSVFSIRTTGTPVGASARAGDAIVTPVGRLDPYIPALHRDHGRDTYSIGLLLHSATDPGRRRLVPVAPGRPGSALGQARITGVAGDLVWFDSPETVVLDAREGRLLSAEDARGATPPPRPAGAEALAALATAERRLERLLGAPGEGGAPATLDAPGGVHGLGFLRAGPDGALLAPGGDRIALFHTRPSREGLLVVARVSGAGEVVWRSETALGALDEALPDISRPAFIGTRPREAGRVPEPLLVVIDAETGRAETHTLLVE